MERSLFYKKSASRHGSIGEDSTLAQQKEIEKQVSPLGYLAFLVLGIFFGIVLTKSEVISWYRIQEMFRFQSFHMYGVIGTAVITGAFLTFLIKRLKLTSIYGTPVSLSYKQMSIPRYLFGGTIFGLGWAMTGACPGPMYTLVGNGLGVYLVVIISAVLGTLTYGAVKHKLPH